MTEQVLPSDGSGTKELGAQDETSSQGPDEGHMTALRSIADLEPGMEMAGKIRSVTDFGAFVELGVGPQGLVHISQLARRRVEKVTDVVQVGDEVQVWIKKVDKKRGRISLTIVKPPTVHLKDLKPDTVIPGVVTRLEPYGVFIDIGTGRDGMVHISELTDGYISAPSEVLSVGDKIDVKVLEVDRKARKVNLSTKDFITVSKAPEPVKEDQSGQAEPAPTMMELAFQAASKREEDSKVSGLERLVAKKANRR